MKTLISQPKLIDSINPQMDDIFDANNDIVLDKYARNFHLEILN